MSTDWTPAAQAHLEARKPVDVFWAVWVRAAPVAGGPVESFGFWTGTDHRDLTIEGQSRLYFGAQAGMEIGDIIQEPGTGVGRQDIALALTPEGVTLARGYDLAGAAIELHCLLFDPDQPQPLGVKRFFRGTIDKAPVPSPPPDQTAVLEIQCISTARRGTMTAAGKKSDASQRERSATDRFREYGDLGETISDPWGAR